MAPARRRGSGRAATAASSDAKHHWKVGDLVLAKMKGFPAWPAAITDPQKWGFSSHKKKVLVYFFGTKQIAFCNHVDIEAFTEEKKKALLTRRQGKGADFVRALEEIIDSYDKSQKEGHNDQLAFANDQVVSADDANGLDLGKFEGSSCKSSVSPKSTVQVNDSDDKKDGCRSDESSPMEVDDHQNVDAVCENPSGNVSILDELRQTPLGAATITSWRKRSRDAPPSSTCITQKRAVTFRRSRSLTKVDPKKLQNAEAVINRGISTNGHMQLDRQKQEFASRSVLPKNSPDNSVCRDIDNVIFSHVIPQTGACRAVPVDCSFSRVEEDSSVLETFEDEPVGTSHECCERSGRVNVAQVEDELLKKIQGPSKKRVSDDLSPQCKLNGEKLPHSPKNMSIPLDSCSKLKERFMKADGDEHLPLVKRARARMRELPVEKRQLDAVIEGISADRHETITAVSNNGDASFRENNSGNADSADVSGSVNILLSNSCTVLKSDHKIKSCHFMGSSMDAEAALPPSKRLHRALEAMSANSVEGRDNGMEAPIIMKMPVNGSTDSSSGIPLIQAESIARNPGDTDLSNQRDRHDVSNCNNEIILSDTSSPSDTSERPAHVLPNSPPTNSNGYQNMDHIKVSSCNADIDLASDKMVEEESSKISKNPESCLSEDNDNTLVESSSSSIIRGNKSLLQTNKECPVSEGHGILVQQMQPKIVSGETTSLNHDSFMDFGRNGSLSSNNIAVHSVTPVALAEGFTTESIKSSSAATGKNLVGNATSRVASETKWMPTSKDLSFSPDLTPMKVLIAAAQAKRLRSRSSSLADNLADARPSSETFLSPSPRFIAGITDRSFSNSEKVDSTSNRSPDPNPSFKSCAQLEVNDPRSDSTPADLHAINNFNGREADAAFKSFEALLCTLTRSKENIAQATRRAIDCARHDIANEVVQSIVLSLEKEPSLHRRVDIFFLVDSITRSCRGTAGDSFIALFLPVLPRLISATAPQGSAAAENRRQCLKVLRLWLERKTFPESIIRQHIRELDSINEPSLNNGYSRRPARTERALDDPVREMEGMLVDEYGSNTSFHLPGLLASHMINDDEGSDADEKIFEAVTPERPLVPGETESNLASEKQRHILKDVDGELEMEDVAPEVTSTSLDAEGSDKLQPSSHQFGQRTSFPFAPPLPEERPPSPPPLPSSPPPLANSSLSHIDQQSSTSNTTTSSSCTNQLMGNNNHFPLPVIQRPEGQNSNEIPESARCYAPGYHDFSKHIPPPIPTLLPCYYNNPGPHPPTQPGLDNLPVGNGTSAGKGYYLQPPPPIISNQFSYVQSEAQRPSAQFGNSVPPGPLYPENIEAPSSSLPYFGPPADSSPAACQSWSHPAGASSHAYAGHFSRPPGNSLSQMAGASAHWRPQ